MRHHLFNRFNGRKGRPLGRAGTAAIAALAASAWIAPALAQPAPPPGAGAPPPAQTEGPGHRGPMGGPGMHPMGGPGWHHGWHHGGRGPFSGLIFHREDKQLTAAEVQKIAEAFLLWQGERNWKVTNVHDAADNKVEFTLTTKEGSTIAQFSMDRKTGRLHRIG